jgi:hypothetical protein
MSMRLEILSLKIRRIGRLAALAIVTAALGVAAGSAILVREGAVSLKKTASELAPSADQPTRLEDSISDTSDGQRPALDVLSIDATGYAVIAGHSAPNDILDLRVDGRIVAQTKADRLGSFEISPPPLASGVHRIELAAPSDVSARVEIEVPRSAGDKSTAAIPKTDVAIVEQRAVTEPTIQFDSPPLPHGRNRTGVRRDAGMTHLVPTPNVRRFVRRRPIVQAALGLQLTPHYMDGSLR